MKRQPLLRALDLYRPYDSREAEMTAKLREFVERHENCFERSLLSGHITGSAWLLDLDRKHALLTHHVKLGKWLQLGGHADGEPDVLSVALREAKEESGLDDIRPVSHEIFDLDVHRIPERGTEPRHFHYDVRYLFEADRRHLLKITPESRALSWVPLEDVRRLTREASVLRMVAKTPRSL